MKADFISSKMIKTSAEPIALKLFITAPLYKPLNPSAFMMCLKQPKELVNWTSARPDCIINDRRIVSRGYASIAEKMSTERAIPNLAAISCKEPSFSFKEGKKEVLLKSYRPK